MPQSTADRAHDVAQGIHSRLTLQLTSKSISVADIGQKFRVGGRAHARIVGPSFTEWLDATYPVKG
ncbi:hypothetical protein [Nocardia rhamnosiphila]|uniref:Uncharacterized protein n=1 Tax=Nocardia rhamnosiphila TaxID=426716 RepID=A0ABV2WSX6_9NOCA